MSPSAAPASAHVVEGPAVRAVHLGPHRRLLSGRRPVRGEKERGTLETLLSSPAARTEIVWGKLLTVMTFSGATALLESRQPRNHRPLCHLATQHDAASATSAKAWNFPPLPSLLWLVVALVPMTALFSALCLACAAFARSTKEGQYYLMPLFLISMPLMMLPLAPGAELNLGNSLIPITGVVLLVMSLVQGDYAEALRYFVPVCGVTLICCHWAIRWAVYQFNQESVLFRESERLDPRRWIVHLIRDRRDTPSLAEAFFCVVLIFVIQFFMQLAITANAPANPDFTVLIAVALHQPGRLHRAARLADDAHPHRSPAQNAAARACPRRYRLFRRRRFGRACPSARPATLRLDS